MSHQKQTAADKKKLLALAPEEATRVRVIDEFGKEKYRKLDEVASNDTIKVKKDGDPVWMVSKPGRKATPRDYPIASEAIAEAIRRKDQLLKEDQILIATTEQPESSTVLHEVMIALADEAASLKFEREEAELRGDSTSQLSARRARILKDVGETWLKRKTQLSQDSFNPDSPEFEAVFGLISETFKSSMLEAGCRGEMVETVFAKFASKLDDEWKSEARNRVKGA